MLENHHIDIDEEEVEEEEDEDEDEDEKEDDYEIIRRMLIMQQVQNYKIASAFITLVMAAMEATQSSSGESDDECSSHYSSLVSPDKSSHNDHEQAVRSGDTYDIRMQRVRLWRDTVIKSMSSSQSLPSKRRTSSYHDDNDNSSASPAKPSKRPRTTSRPTGYKCPACSIPFLSQQSLHQHARMPQAHEACRAAVGYNFE